MKEECREDEMSIVVIFQGSVNGTKHFFPEYKIKKEEWTQIYEEYIEKN